MKITIDKEKCIGCGACVAICEEVFEFDDEGLAYVKNNVNFNNYQDEIVNAVESCPTEAINKE